MISRQSQSLNPHQDKLKFYLPESLLYKINNPDAEFLFHIGIVLLVIVLIVLLIGDQKNKR